MAALPLVSRRPFRKRLTPSRRLSFPVGPMYLATLLLPYTRRRLGGRQPLCGIGVTSRIDLISTPAACSARIADSRPLPGPLTRMSTERSPESFAAVAQAVAACCAANGVPLREPLKPRVPAEDQATTFPSRSVIVT